MRKFFLISILNMFVFYSPANADLVDRLNGTVTDLTTGLMWQQIEAGAMTWTQAQSYCENLRLAQFNDWRLPTCIELRSIVDYSRSYPAINTGVFPGTVSAGYWSSTPYVLHSNIAYVVNFADGSVDYDLKSNILYVRAVRGEP
jgi:hypothetical protein